MKRTFALLSLAALAAASQAALIGVFDFNNTLNPAFAATANTQALQFYKGGTNPTLQAGGPTYVTDTVGAVNKKVAQFGKTEGFKSNHGIPTNGGGAYGNIYTILFDVKMTATSAGWASFYQTSATNNNDGDMFFKVSSGNNGNFGITGDYGVSNFAFLNSWHRVVLTVDLTKNTNTMGIYLDGALTNSVDIAGGVDGRFALYTTGDGDPTADHMWLMMDENGDNGAGSLSQVAYWDTALTGDQVKNLGAVGSSLNPVPEPASMVVLGGLAMLVARRRRSNA
ncbi:MAG: PEP-CTERM sorting domain-containing protein [Armatimonadetes bacterium]|nr:PEP-CTERM sorting domain-containing protein [Armatimonadota bacterium]